MTFLFRLFGVSQAEKISTLQETNIPHLGKRKNTRLKSALKKGGICDRSLEGIPWVFYQQKYVEAIGIFWRKKAVGIQLTLEKKTHPSCQGFSYANE